MRSSFHSVSFWIAMVMLSSCAYNDVNKLVDCSKSDLAVALISQLNPTQCLAIDGSITVSASGDTAPYAFSINDGSFQSGNTFDKLGPGVYSIIVKGTKGCISSPLQVELVAPNSTLAASSTTTPDSDCFTDNGSITVIGSQGKPPYQFQFEQRSFGSASTFNNLKFGTYLVTIKDADGCPKALSVTVPRSNTGISYSGTIKSILDTNCNTSGCHNGDLGASRDWRTYATVKNDAASIKSRTVNKSMPPAGNKALTQEQISQITCWVDDGALNN
ncbi:MAG: SprB repeat-containing protein [Cyclobacteriaceae bacterium]|jgi:SprB repeat